MDFMQAYLATRDREHQPQFHPPSNIVFLAEDRSSGTIAPAEDEGGAVGEAFISGTEPR
jgi:membrane carboxypeptidase/penicillin-binding protein